MNEYEVIRTSTYFHDKIPCNIVHDQKIMKINSIDDAINLLIPNSPLEEFIVDMATYN